MLLLLYHFYSTRIIAGEILRTGWLFSIVRYFCEQVEGERETMYFSNDVLLASNIIPDPVLPYFCSYR